MEKDHFLQRNVYEIILVQNLYGLSVPELLLTQLGPILNGRKWDFLVPRYAAGLPGHHSLAWNSFLPISEGPLFLEVRLWTMDPRGQADPLDKPTSEKEFV